MGPGALLAGAEWVTVGALPPSTAALWSLITAESTCQCGKMDCWRIETMLKAISPLMSCSCTNYQRIGTGLPLIGHSCVQ